MKHLAALTMTLTLLVTTAALPAAAATGENSWPTWRGPKGSGAALKGNPPTTWSESENIKWKVPVPGKGLSSPVIWEGKIFFLTAIDTGQPGEAEPGSAAQAAASQPPAPPAGGRPGGPGGPGRSGPGGTAPKTICKFDVVCMDRATGKILWEKTAKEAVPHEGTHPTGSFASYSPVTDGRLVWASFGSRGLYCYDMEGNLKWSNPLIPMKIKMGFGEGGSPCLAGDSIYVVCDHEGQSVIFAFDKETGQVRWRKDRDEKTAWATPVSAEVGGKVQIITNATSLTRSYDAKTGEILWQSKGQTDNVIPTPIVAFDKVFLISGFRGSALQAVRLDRTGDLTGTDAIVWQMKDGTPYVPSPAMLGERLFFCSDGGNKGVISCYNAVTGKALYSKQALVGIDSIYASFAGVGDRVYVAGRNGVTVVVKNADTFEILATNKLDDGFDASPAIVGDELYLKGNKSFYCIARR
jgi:outer membrane protein assembly factor BamB